MLFADLTGFKVFRKDFSVVSPTLLEQTGEYIVIKGIISHLSRFLKDD